MPTIMRQINVISRCEGLYRTDKLRGAELGACHHSYVLAVCRTPGISQEELARSICINKSNVTRHLAYLEEHGYVERRQSESDRRVPDGRSQRRGDRFVPVGAGPYCGTGEKICG